MFTGLSTCMVVWNTLCLMFTGLSTCMVVWNALCFNVYWVIYLYSGLECVV